ncbi:ABC transporter ATPase [Photobacterium salinisoli]|uniref:ABC transporter ATPase n=1 Tax=Photobacterium salinisoli TaxID=1616783 RepID=UPI000EA265D5|nr:ABC transporter ATPase [Photobacterium salinisoli]
MKPSIAYTNTTHQPQNIGGRTVLPGETREVDARFVNATALVNRDLMILFINLDASPRFFGTTKVLPGEAVRVSVIHFENPNRENAGAVQDRIFEQLLENKIDIIKPYFSELEDGELSRLAELEQAGDKRKTLLEDIDNELAVRMAERNFSPAEYAQQLDAMTDEDLQLELLSVGDDSRKIVAIQDELAKRSDLQKQEE